MLAWPAVSIRRRSQVLRTALVSLMLALTMVAIAVPQALSEESMSELQARMEDLQGELNAAQSRIEELRTEQDTLEHRMEEADARVKVLKASARRTSAKVVKSGKRKNAIMQAQVAALSPKDILDLSAFYDSSALAVVMTCAAA